MKSSAIIVKSLLLLSKVVAAAAAHSLRGGNKVQKGKAYNTAEGKNRPKSRGLRGQNNDETHKQQHGVMKMILHTDRYPSETSWQIIDNCNQDSIVMSGGNYKTPFTTFKETINLPPSQYTMMINDAYGDGICCGQGNGSFQVMFNNEIVASGGQFGKSESQTWGSCPQETNTPVPTASPTKPPTAAPTTCDMSYELILKIAPSSSSGATFWDFAYGQDRSRNAASSSGISYSPGSVFMEKGCLPKNCYRFQINGGGIEMYSLFIDGMEVIRSGTEEITDTETSLFGTCESILV